MVKPVLLLACALVPAFAQFGSLATNYDGSTVYFVSNLRQAGTQQPPWGKAFVAANSGVQPLAIRNRDVHMVDPLYYYTNPFNLTAVTIAHDGSRLALLGVPDCDYGSPCFYNDQAQTDVYDNVGRDILTISCVRATLSPNGRWALLSDKTPFGIFAMGVVDLTTGQSSTPAWGNYQWSPIAIADNGTVAVASLSALEVVRPDGSSITIPALAEAGAFDSNGATLVWTDSRDALQVLNTSTLAQRVLFVGTTYPPAITDDGRRVLFLSAASADGSPQVFVIATDGTGLRQVSNEASGIQNAALSGDGHVAWVLDGDGSVVRLGIDTGERKQLIGPSVNVPLPFRTFINASPGQPVQVTGQRLAPQGGEVQARNGNTSLPVLSANDTSITFQVPWNTSPDPAYDVEFTIPGRQDPAWIPVVRLNLAAAAPQFIPPAFHEGFTSAITATSPVRPGEVITFYAVGLGPVSPPVATGQVAPISPLSLLVSALPCSAPDATNRFVPVDVLFAGLAPGTVGYYQVNVRLPATLPADLSAYEMQCGQGAGGFVVWLAN